MSPIDSQSGLKPLPQHDQVVFEKKDLPPPKTGWTRRQFLTRTVTAALAGAVLNAVGREPILRRLSDVLQNLAEQDVVDVSHFMVDYVAEPALTEPLMDTLAAETVKTIPDLITEIKGIPDFNPGQDEMIGSLLEFKHATKDINPSEAALQQLIDVTKPIIASLIDEALFVVGEDHGKFVQRIYRDQLAALDVKKPKDETDGILALQAFLSEISFSSDAIGTVSVQMTIDAQALIKVLEQVYQKHPDQKKVTTVSTLSFNFGELHAQIALFETPKVGEGGGGREQSDVILTEVDNSDTGKSDYFLPFPNDFNDRYFQAYADADSKGGIDAVDSYLDPDSLSKLGEREASFEVTFRYRDGSEEKITTPALKVDISDPDMRQKKKDKEASAFLQKKVQEFLAAIPSAEDRQKMHGRLQTAGLISPVTNYKEAIQYNEPYFGAKSQENFQGFVDFCTAFPNILAIHAGGNSSDIRSITVRPENGLVSSSVNAAGEARFGRDGKIGCLGADIYLLDEDFIENGDYNVFSTSQTVGILSAYSEVFAGKGLTPIEIKKVILELCTVTQDIVHNKQITIVDARIFKPELAASALGRSATVLRQAVQSF